MELGLGSGEHEVACYAALERHEQHGHAGLVEAHHLATADGGALSGGKVGRGQLRSLGCGHGPCRAPPRP